MRVIQFKVLEMAEAELPPFRLRRLKRVWERFLMAFAAAQNLKHLVRYLALVPTGSNNRNQNLKLQQSKASFPLEIDPLPSEPSRVFQQLPYWRTPDKCALAACKP